MTARMRTIVYMETASRIFRLLADSPDMGTKGTR